MTYELIVLINSIYVLQPLRTAWSELEHFIWLSGLSRLKQAEQNENLSLFSEENDTNINFTTEKHRGAALSYTQQQIPKCLLL